MGLVLVPTNVLVVKPVLPSLIPIRLFPWSVKAPKTSGELAFVLVAMMVLRRLTAASPLSILLVLKTPPPSPLVAVLLAIVLLVRFSALAKLL